VVRRSPAAARIFLQCSNVPEPGFRLVQKDLADTLERLTAHGLAGFYTNETAKKLVEGVRAAGGICRVSAQGRTTTRCRIECNDHPALFTKKAYNHTKF